MAGCHLIMVLAAYLYARRQGDAIQGATEAFIVFLMPVAGFILVVGARMRYMIRIQTTR